MDVDQPESVEEEAEATARDEIASLLGPAILSQFTVRAHRDPEQREVLRLLLRYGDNGPESTVLPLSPPDNMADVPRDGDAVIGQPLCADCYDHDHPVVWNVMSGELWRRTTATLAKHLKRHRVRLPR